MAVRHPAEISARTDVRIREATEADDPRIVEIGNILLPDFRETLHEFRQDRSRRLARGLTDMIAVAEEQGGTIVGYWHAHHMLGQFAPGRYRANVFVEPLWQGRGVGSALFDHMQAALLAGRAEVIESFARETSAEIIAFLTNRGFRETLRTWELRLDLAGFDPAPYARYIDHVREAGVEIVTLRDEHARDPEALRRAHALREAVMADIPSPIPFTPVPFEEFVHSNIESPRALPDAYFLARAAGAYIGVADLRRSLEGTHLMHNITGVLPAYRGRGIAIALKLATIAYGRAGGYSEIRTWNEVRNTGMLVINERLGFVRQPAWITFEKTLSTPNGWRTSATGGPFGA